MSFHISVRHNDRTTITDIEGPWETQKQVDDLFEAAVYKNVKWARRLLLNVQGVTHIKSPAFRQLKAHALMVEDIAHAQIRVLHLNDVQDPAAQKKLRLMFPAYDNEVEAQQSFSDTFALA